MEVMCTVAAVDGKSRARELSLSLSARALRPPPRRMTPRNRRRDAIRRRRLTERKREGATHGHAAKDAAVLQVLR